MATLRDIRSRIKGVNNTSKITKAMKMVAAAKLRRAQDNIINARPYAKKIGGLLGHLMTDEELAVNPLFAPKPSGKVLLVVVTADRGLCGAFNTNVLREANRVIAEDIVAKGLTPVLYCVGKKGYDHFKKKPFEVAFTKTQIFNSLKFDHALEVGNQLLSSFTKGDYGSVWLVYNEFKSVATQRVVAEQYLPIPARATANTGSHTDTNYIYEPGQLAILQALLPKYLTTQIWRVLMESNASEFGARMTAMDNATNNAKELGRQLRLKYNRERQAAITKEILEIVSGANALNG